MFSQSQRLIGAGLLGSFLSLGFLPTAALAQQGQLTLTSKGTVQKWNKQTKAWEPFAGGTASEGDTYRAIEGGNLDGRFPNGTHFVLKSCSAVRFLHLSVQPGANTVYAKAFGEIDTSLPAGNGQDDLKWEFPVGLEVLGKDAANSVSGSVGHNFETVFQTPTARVARLCAGDQTRASLQPLSCITGTVTALDPAAGTFIVQNAQSGQTEKVLVRWWSQLARKTLGERLLNETPGQVVQSLTVGQTVTIYGVATAAPPPTSMTLGGSAAFGDTPDINYFANVIFPPGGQYIYGGSFVLSTPTTPASGSGTPFISSTSTLEAGNLNPTVTPGFTPKNVVCEVADEVFAIIPPVAPVLVGAGSPVGSTVVYALVGVGVAALVSNHGTVNNTPISLP